MGRAGARGDTVSQLRLSGSGARTVSSDRAGGWRPAGLPWFTASRLHPFTVRLQGGGEGGWAAGKHLPEAPPDAITPGVRLQHMNLGDTNNSPGQKSKPQATPRESPPVCLAQQAHTRACTCVHAHQGDPRTHWAAPAAWPWGRELTHVSVLTMRPGLWAHRLRLQN